MSHYFIDITNVPENMINDHELFKSKCSELLEEFQMYLVTDLQFQKL